MMRFRNALGARCDTGAASSGEKRGESPPASRHSIASVVAIAFALGCMCATAVGAAELTAREIMEAVDAVDDGDSGVSDLEMVLIDKHDKKRVRKLRSFSKDFDENDYGLVFFLAPADVKDTGFLTYDYDGDERDDDQWLFLPALKKTKRIASSDKSGSFMGSDFTYADMSSRETENYDYTLQKETEVDGHKVWQIESVPRTEKERDETGYEKSVVFVRQDNFMVTRAVNWVKRGKRLKYLDVKTMEQIDGIWVGTEVHMTTKKGKATLHKTVLRSTNVRFNQGLSDDVFTVRQLEKGLP
jgi:hypothetical protein